MLDMNIVEKEMCPIGLAGHLLVDKWVPIILRDIALFDRRGFNEILKKKSRRNFVCISCSSTSIHGAVGVATCEKIKGACAEETLLSV